MIPVFIAMVFVVMLLINATRLINNMEHYDTISFGNADIDAQNTFRAYLIDQDLIEPTLIVSAGDNTRVLDIKIDDVIVWDIQEWILYAKYNPPSSGIKDTNPYITTGITKDNSIDASDPPIADGADTLPGGSGAFAATDEAELAGTEVPKFECYGTPPMNLIEEITAVGEIVTLWWRMIDLWPHYKPYTLDGNTFYKLLTAAHYWLWCHERAMTTTEVQLSLGGVVRPVSVDLMELVFDRGQVLSILEVLSAF